MKKKVVFVGMSGGVDSSVSAAILKEQGYDVVGVFIRTWHPDFIKCNEEEERLDAMRVATHLDIPFLTFDFEEVYKKQVADYMISEYKAGRTPNPDVMCNKEVKFGAFLDKAISMGADFVATGHYANKKDIYSINKNFKNSSAFALGDTEHGTHDALNSLNFCLEKAKDNTKDQVYFLWTLKQKQLRRILFPIGNLNKTEVRKLAQKFKIPVAEKKDSQGICFLGAVDLKDFLGHYIKEKKGKVLLATKSLGEIGNEKEEEIGYHNGVMFFTLGERHGFTITKKTQNEKPYYIVKKDLKKNILYVSNDLNFDNSLKKTSYFLEKINWISIVPQTDEQDFFMGDFTAQVRYHGEFLKCNIKNIQKDKIEIIFEKSVIVASGQSCVLYNKNICLGGGIII